MVTFNLCNNVIVLLVLILYSFTIILLRKSIAKCASYQFETRGTYVITSLYIATLAISMAFLITYQFFDFQIVVEQLLHKLVGLMQILTVYIMIQKSGSGLSLVPHKLNNGAI